MKLFVKDKTFYQRALAIAIPIAMQSAITIGVNLADTVMVGKLGETALSATALAGQFVNIFGICCMGLGMGASVLTARFWGMKDIPSLKKALTIMLRLVLILAVVFFMIPSFFIPGGIMKLYSDDSAVIAEGIKYLRWMVPCYILQGLSMTCTIVLRSVGQVKIPLFSSIGAFFVNIFFNYMFIFGKFGAPALEVEGAAVGTFIARIFEFLFICGYLFVIDKKIKYRIPDFLTKCKDLLPTYISISIPVFISDTLLALGNSAVAMVMGHIGKNFVSANSITVVTQQLSTVLIQGICHASCIMTGHTLGEGKIQKAKDEAWTFLGLSAVVGIVGAFIILIIKWPVINFYDITDDTKVIANELMNSIALIVVFQSMNSILTKGVLRAGGDTKFLMAADILFLWILSIPLGALAGLVWHLDAFWIYFFLKVDQVVKAVWCLFRLNGDKWIKVIKNGSD